MTISPVTPKALCTSIPEPTSVSTVSANSPPTNGTRLFSAYFAVRSVTPSIAAAVTERVVSTPMNTVNPMPSDHTAHCCVNSASRCTRIPSPKWQSIHNTPDATASGTVMPEIRLVIALADATTAGCISAEPALPPTAAIIVSSIGSSPCIPAEICCTVVTASVMWSLKSCVRNTHTNSCTTMRPHSLLLPLNCFSSAQSSAGAISRVSRQRLCRTAEKNCRESKSAVC